MPKLPMRPSSSKWCSQSISLCKRYTFVFKLSDKTMKIRNKFQTWLLQEDLNFLLTNRIPRITLTRLMGWWSQLRHPWIVKGSIAVWRWFTDLDLNESKQQTFTSLHACFTRELRPGLRPIDAVCNCLRLCSPSQG